MNVKIEKSELVDIQGLTEAAVASSDIQLIGIVNYADLASSYLTEDEFEAEGPTHPTIQVREACLGELCRRHGDDYMCPDDREWTRDQSLADIKAVA